MALSGGWVRRKNIRESRLPASGCDEEYIWLSHPLETSRPTQNYPHPSHGSKRVEGRSKMFSWVLFELFFLLPPSALAMPGTSSITDAFNKTIHNFIPKQGNGTLADEISCYALPYGYIGVLGHILTYWTVASLIVGRKPWLFWVELRWHILNLILEVLTFLPTVPIAIYTIYRCRGRWQYILLAVWKTTLTLSSLAIGVQRAYSLPKDKQKADAAALLNKIQSQQSSQYSMLPTGEESGYGAGQQTFYGMQQDGTLPTGEEKIKNSKSLPPKANLLWYLVFYFFGALAGLTGLISIVSEVYPSNPHLRSITGVFIGLAVGPTCFTLGFAILIGRRGKNISLMGLITAHFFDAMGTLIIWVTMLAAFYSDMALGAMTNDLVGAPSDENKYLYWTYFIAKRIPFFSS
jgi:hypothetical protein